MLTADLLDDLMSGQHLGLFRVVQLLLPVAQKVFPLLHPVDDVPWGTFVLADRAFEQHRGLPAGQTFGAGTSFDHELQVLGGKTKAASLAGDRVVAHQRHDCPFNDAGTFDHFGERGQEAKYRCSLGRGANLD